MGKKIDRFILSAAIAAGLYLYFRSTFQNRIVSFTLAMLVSVILGRTFQSLRRMFSGSAFARKRKIRRSAGSALMHIACMDKNEAAGKLRSLLNKAYNYEGEIELLQFHPESSFSIDMLFDIWKKHRNIGSIAICTTCRSDAACKAFASAAKHPKIALIDADALSQLITEYPDGMFPEEENHVQRRLRLHRIRDLIINRKNAPRCFSVSVSAFLLYVFSSNVLYLAAAVFLLFTAIASIHQKRRPSKLF